eukprot:UN01661
MGYKINCCRCGHNYYTVCNGTWNTPGTVTVYPEYGYCGSCAGGKSYSWTWTGNVVKVECHSCTNLIKVISWSTWRKYNEGAFGYCNGCYNTYIKKKRK